MSLGEAALRYAKAGVPIFPLAPGGKVPLTAQGVYAATTDLYEVQAWWARTPNANIGMPTGEYSGWDVLDVDVDGKHPEGGRQRSNGWDVLRPILDSGAIPPPIMTIGTPSGGAHLYYAALPGARNGSMSQHGLDYRSNGGYVVAPPSRTAAGAYEITSQPNPRYQGNQCDFSLLRDLIRRTEALPMKPAARPRPGVHQTGQAERRLEALERTVAGAAIGSRNNILYWAARVVVEENLEGLDRLFHAAQRAGLSSEESAKTLQSALRGPVTPRSITPSAQEPAAPSL